MRETKEKIMQKALQYFVENSYEKASLNDIAGNLGITKGAIYHYFGSKDDLFREVLLHTIGELEATLSQIMPKNADWEEIVVGLFSFRLLEQEMSLSLGIEGFDDSIDLVYLMVLGFKKYPEVKERLRKTYQEMERWLLLALKRGIEEGSVKEDLNCETMAFELIALTEGTILVGGLIQSVDMERMGKGILDDFVKRIRR